MNSMYASTDSIHNDRFYNRKRGKRKYELKNHLGNVLATITDRKLPQDNDKDALADYYKADIVTADDYYPFGMGMPGRHWTADSTDQYRFGFNGKEKDGEWNSANMYNYKARMHDPRLGRFLSVDPKMKEFPMLSSYQYASNNPIKYIDLDGLEAAHPRTGNVKKENTTVWSGPKGMDPKSVKEFSHTYQGETTTTRFSERGPTNNIALAFNLSFSTLLNRDKIQGLRDAMNPAIQKVSEEIVSKAPDLSGPEDVQDQASGGMGKAFRHITAQALVTKKFGSQDAKVMGDFYERVNENDPIEIRWRDLINNEYGRELGQNYDGELKTREDYADFLNQASNQVLEAAGYDKLSEDEKFTADSEAVRSLHSHFEGDNGSNGGNGDNQQE